MIPGIAIVQAPRALPRVIRLPREMSEAEYDFIFLSSIMHTHVSELFAGMKVVNSYQFRVTRNSELFVDEEEVKDLRTALRGELPHRQFGDEVRLEVAENCPAQISDFLLAQFNLMFNLYSAATRKNHRRKDFMAGETTVGEAELAVERSVFQLLQGHAEGAERTRPKRARKPLARTRANGRSRTAGTYVPPMYFDEAFKS